MSSAPDRARSMPASLEALYATAVQRGLFPSQEHLRYYAGWIFADCPLRRRSVLDVGCGHGLLSLYARLSGAARVVGLEPEADGASHLARTVFSDMVHELGADGVEVRGETLEQCAQSGERFNVILLCQVINHLDERACEQLHRSNAAREHYLSIFTTLLRMLEPRGALILTDCGRRNAWRPLVGLGVPHPFVPTIQWRKHQEPRVWLSLLAEAGFRQARLSWRTPNRLRRLEPLLSNGFAARCLTSEFRILARS